MGTVGATIQEFEGLSIGSDQGTAPAGVDFVAAVGTELDPTGNEQNESSTYLEHIQARLTLKLYSLDTVIYPPERRLK